MKGKILFISVMILGLLTACHPSHYLHDFLEDQAQRGKLYHEILKNEVYRAQLLDSIQSHPKAKDFLRRVSEGDGAGNRHD